MSSALAHRSSHVQSVARLVSIVSSKAAAQKSARQPALVELWTLCASTEAFVSSLASDAIADLVRTANLDWAEAIQGFEDSLATAKGASLDNMVHSLSMLIIQFAENGAADRAEKPKSLPTTTLTKFRIPFGIKSRRHPFITLVIRDQSVEPILLAEVDAIIKAKDDNPAYQITAFSILSPFLDFCLLDRLERGEVISSAVVHWIGRQLTFAIQTTDSVGYAQHVLSYLCSVPARFPLDRTRQSSTFLSILQTLCDFVTSPVAQQGLDKESMKTIGSNLVWMLLQLLADGRHYGMVIFPLLQQTFGFVKTCQRNARYTAPALMFVDLWPVLSYLLMDAPSLVEQKILVDWMHVCIMAESVSTLDPAIANLALLPLFQVMSESRNEATSKKCFEVLRILEGAARGSYKTTTPSAGTLPSTGEKRSNTLRSSGTIAAIQAEQVLVKHLWTENSGFLAEYSLNSDITLSSLTLSTFALHPDELIRMEAISRLAHIESNKLVTLAVFMFLIKIDRSARVRLHLLQEAVPTLVTSNDEVTTMRVLKTVLAMIHGNEPGAQRISGGTFKSTGLGAIGVRILFSVWRQQPRAWKALRHVISEWVQARIRMHKPPRRGEVAHDMEVAVLTTIRDICAINAPGYAEMLIPFLSTLLRNVELLPSSLCIILETLNLSVESQVVEPRVAWNVLLCHLAEHAMQIKHPAMLQILTEFYGEVGSRTEDTQVYIEFKQAVLENYIAPLLKSTDPRILSAALRALARFPASEIQSVLSHEQPMLFIRELILHQDDSLVVDEFSMVLNKLVRHELLHMRRSLFKDNTKRLPISATNAASPELEVSRRNFAKISSTILKKWQSGNVDPGLRIGYALSSLSCSPLPGTTFSAASSGYDHGSPTDDLSVVRTRQEYRDLMAALVDVTLTDHILERITAMEGWVSAYEGIWEVQDEARTLYISETLMSDLHRKLEEGHVPAHCGNTIMAMCGLIFSLHRYSHPASTVHATQLSNFLIQNYVDLKNTSEIGRSDEVQFAVLATLGAIAPLAAVDERLVHSVARVFMDRVKAEQTNSSPNEISSWSSFASGWALCNFLCGLLDSPTRTADLLSLCCEALQLLSGTLESPTSSFDVTIGIMMGLPKFSSGSSSTDGQEESMGLIKNLLNFARTDLERFLAEPEQTFTSQSLARFLGSPWVVAYGDKEKVTVDTIRTESVLLEKVLALVTARRDLQTHLVNLMVPHSHMLHSLLNTRNPTSGDITLFTNRVHGLINTIKITTTTAARHTSVLALGACLGLDWCRSSAVTVVSNRSSSSATTDSGLLDGAFSFLAANVTMVPVMTSAMNTLLQLSGVGITWVSDILKVEDAVGSLNNATATSISTRPTTTVMTQDLKAGRLAVMVLGLESLLISKLSSLDQGKIMGTNNEPKDFSRLPISSSWLRAIWENLWEPLLMGTATTAERKRSYRKSLELLMYTIESLPAPLPSVNWFPLLSQLVKLEPGLWVSAVELASRHAHTSLSLMEFLVNAVTGFFGLPLMDGSSSPSVQEILVGETGIGRLLTLAGLGLLGNQRDTVLIQLGKVRGLDGLAKRTILPVSRAFELVEILVNGILLRPGLVANTVSGNNNDRVWQLMLLDTLDHHMNTTRYGPLTKNQLGGSGNSQITITSTQSKSMIDKTFEAAQGMLVDLRRLLLQVFGQIRISLTEKESVETSQQVLRRLADLSMLSLAHLDSVVVSGPLTSPSSPSLSSSLESTATIILQKSVGLCSLYSAGYLTTVQEARLTELAREAIQEYGVVLLMKSEMESDDDERLKEVEIAQFILDQTISQLLFGMYHGSKGNKHNHRNNNNKTEVRLVWLQRILDLLILISDQELVLSVGIRLLFGGAAVQWWGEEALRGLKALATSGSGGAGRDIELLHQKEEKDHEDLMALIDENVEELDDGFGGGMEDETTGIRDGEAIQDANGVEDDRMEGWILQYKNSLGQVFDLGQSDEHSKGSVSPAEAIAGRIVFVLADALETISRLGSVEKETVVVLVKRLLQMLQHQIKQEAFKKKSAKQEQDDDFGGDVSSNLEQWMVVQILRRLEPLVPDGQTWLLV